MTDSQAQTAGPADFAASLRRFRTARNMSQFGLALACEVSARHVSFLESGRAQPSRAMVQKLAAGLTLPPASWNALLHAAGFAPLFPASPLESEALEPLRSALSDMMARHAPYPALLLDRYWTLLDANESARAMLAAFLAESGETNMIRLLTRHPDAAARIGNLPDMLLELTGRLELEALHAGDDPVLRDLLRELKTASQRYRNDTTPGPRRPLMPLVIHAQGRKLRFLSAIVQFGTSQDVTVRDLRLELLFPADQQTRAAFSASLTSQ